MRRDLIFYQLFVQSPILLFDLIPYPPKNAQQYIFDAIEVKETRKQRLGWMVYLFRPIHLELFISVRYNSKLMSYYMSECLLKLASTPTVIAIYFSIGKP